MEYKNHQIYSLKYMCKNSNNKFKLTITFNNFLIEYSFSILF